ncbi:MAG: NAD-dependent protein deacetylase [Myxococcota bacterium]
MACVPPAPTPDPAALDALHRLLDGRRIAVLTGAGCSTESGIPDYRGPVTRRRARNPVQYRAFMRDPEARRRYWARAVVGWGRFAGKHPNAAHRALAALEQAGVVRGLVTQNVDRLHQRAGSSAVVELHGALAEVRCTACHHVEPRGAVQRRLLALNPGWTELHAEMAPDGDAELPADLIARFRVAACLGCGGFLKPNVVFFGENVPRERVERAHRLVEAAEVLLVVGSSLAVFSGYRFVKRAAALGLPIAIVNLGESRGDPHAQVLVQGRAGDVIPRLMEATRSAGPPWDSAGSRHASKAAG